MKASKPAFLLALILLFFNLSAISQDVIVRTNGTRTSAKIVEVDHQSVSYFKPSDPEKTVFKLDLNYVAQLIYEDGKTVNFDVKPPMLDSEPEPPKRNILQTNVLGTFTAGNINLTYERLFGTGSFSYFGEAAVGLSPAIYEIDEYNNLFPSYDSYEYNNNMTLKSTFYIQTGFLFNIRTGIFRFSTGFSFRTIMFKTNEGHHMYGVPVFNLQAKANIFEQFGIFVGYDPHISQKYLGTILYRVGGSYSF